MSILAIDQLAFVNAKALFIRADGRIMVLERAVDHGIVPRRSWYDIPGGKNQISETLRDTLIRELAEELGLAPTDYLIHEQIGTYKTDITFDRDGLRVGLFVVIYRCTLTDGSEPRPMDPANRAIYWQTPAEICQHFEKYSPDFVDMIKKLSTNN